MSARTKLSSTVHWLFGSLPTPERAPHSTALMVFVASVAALVIEADLRHHISAGKWPAYNDVWTLTTYGALPLAALVAWELGRNRGAWAVWALGTIAILATPVLRFVAEGWEEAMRADARIMLVPAVVGALVVLGAARVGKVDLSKWGVGLGDWRWWLPRTAVFFVLMILMVVVAAWVFPDLREAYPRYKPARTSLEALFRYQVSLGWYMIGWEFFFRAFLLFGMARRGDYLMAVLFQAMIFFILHHHKPDVEMAASFVGAIGAGYFCLRARSFLPLFFLHWAMNFNMEAVGFVWRNAGSG
ncbi:MAG: CPBP family intramembrane metalloprotease [Deltaproteobacteria bacterium]|nr:CPBP family intramembrane metalloprotease [Deltaproteobacteria bacterium]MBW2254316.1 CPBP family intramembrane metalloprotease [Deltaproteobacteria bacterium]